jgi:hypothetical protein
MSESIATTRALLQRLACSAADGRRIAGAAKRVARGSRRTLALAVPLMLGHERGVPLEEITVRGSLEPASQQIRGTISTAVPTPLGKVPVNGHVVAGYTCEGSFAGTVGYAFLVRMAARLKRIDLVQRVDGQVVTPERADCALTAERIAGHFWIADSVLNGYVRAGAESLAVAGTVRAVGDSAYHAVLCPTDRTGSYTALVNLYER